MTEWRKGSVIKERNIGMVERYLWGFSKVFSSKHYNTEDKTFEDAMG